MLTADRRRLVHHLLRAGILAGFAMYIVHLVRNDSITLYIAPRMVLYVKLSAIGLYAAAVYQLYAALQAGTGRKAADCDCDHEPPASLWKNIIIYGLFLFPLTIGFLLPDGTLGSSMAAKKGFTFSIESSLTETAPAPTTGPLTEQQLNALFPAEEFTESLAEYAKKLYLQDEIIVPEKQYIETLSTLELYRPHFIGKTIVISGFVYRQEGMTRDQFAVSRFVMNCCSADAMPYGMMASAPSAAAYSNDSWVTVRGTLTEISYNNQMILQLDVKHMEVIDALDAPYVYPDYNFDL
ncbi:TIGR03943 family putative permease subunit [Paenibacillus mendelii]|uniref:TIGR03943 family putative permease subunit n=1 Tax=Paenibacillus mendelii TaxID=206163 RepID=A0ABV6JIV3_9BACL|nr:TIGR03943 family protein [Paenibacillus mendelii]MCQ6558772.1 TIGR03943 family protein [Paenibacillus mendelii]